MHEPVCQFVYQRGEFLFGAEVDAQRDAVADQPSVNAIGQGGARQAGTAALEIILERLNACGHPHHRCSHPSGAGAGRSSPSCARHLVLSMRGRNHFAMHIFLVLCIYFLDL